MVGCMAVMARERWTDQQLDKAFGRIDGDLRELRVEMKKGFEQMDKRFEQVDKRFEQIDTRFERVEDRFHAMQRNMNILFVTLNATLIGGLIATQL
jgi:chaperonin cofactor prefoldin